MGILSNSVSICHFRVVGDVPATDLYEWVSENLRKQAFRPIDQGMEELSVGWVHTTNNQESGFAVPADFWHDHYLAFTLRQDRRKIPGPLLKAYLQVAEHEFLAENPGYAKVPRQKKDELRESVRARILARTLPVPSCHDAVWDTRSGVLTFASLSRSVTELLENQFKKTFPGLRLVAVHPFARAEEIVEDSLKSALAAANRAGSETALDLIVSNRWLGWELLLWVMYRTMNGEAQYRICRPGPDETGRPYIAYINDRLVLCGTGESMQKITVAGPQDRFSEVRAALRQGKVINEAAILFEKGDDLWKMTLKGELFHFASLKAPKVKEEKDNSVDRASELVALFFERMHLLEQGMQLFDSLFSAFLSTRLGPAWNTEMARIGEWLAQE